MLNEGLVAFGADPDIGVFQDSGLQSVRLSSTLKRLEDYAFRGCGALESV